MHALVSLLGNQKSCNQYNISFLHVAYELIVVRPRWLENIRKSAKLWKIWLQSDTTADLSALGVWFPDAPAVVKCCWCYAASRDENREQCRLILLSDMALLCEPTTVTMDNPRWRPNGRGKNPKQLNVTKFIVILPCVVRIFSTCTVFVMITWQVRRVLRKPDAGHTTIMSISHVCFALLSKRQVNAECLSRKSLYLLLLAGIVLIRSWIWDEKATMDWQDLFAVGSNCR